MFDEHLTRQHRLNYFVRGPEWAIALPRGDLEALEDVMRRCASFWNGPGTLLIPVREDGGMPRLLDTWLGIRPVDACFTHERLGDPARAAVQARIPLTHPLRDTCDEHELHPLDLWGRSLPIEGQELLSMLLPSFASAGLQRAALALFGHMTEDDLPYWRYRYNIARVGEPHAHSTLLHGQMPTGNSPLRLAANNMNAVAEHPPPLWSYLWVLPDASFDRLIAFWNFRARTLQPPYGARVVGLPRESLRHPQQLLALAHWVPRLAGVRTTPDIGVVCPRYLVDEVREVLATVPLVKTNETFRWEVGSGTTPNDPPTYNFHRPRYWPGPMARGTAATALVAFNDGKAALSLPAPESFAARSLRRTRLVLQNLPLPLPVTRSAARRVREQAEASDGVLTVTAAQSTWNFDVRLPTAEEALDDWISDHGFVLTRSQDGRDAEALLTRLGSLDALNVLADRNRVAVLEKLAPLSRKKLAQRLVREARAAEAHLDEDTLIEKLADYELFLKAEAKSANDIATAMGPGVRKRDVLQLLPPLVEAGFVLRGREVRCTTCRFRNQLDLPEQDERIRCRACGQTQVLPVVDESGDNEPELTYRLDGLLARVMDQDVLPVLLTVRALRPLPESSDDLFFAWPGVEVKKARSPRFDVDVVVSYGSTRVWCIEAKRRASGLQTPQLSRLLQVAEELDAVPGIAALEGEFSTALANRVLKLGGLVLTEEQLFA